MYNTIDEFVVEWNEERNYTQKVLDALTDSSLQQQVSPNDRTLGRIAWHIVTSVPSMLSKFGFDVETVPDSATVQSSAKEITEGFQKISAGTIDIVRKQWTDESLKDIRNVFGMDLPNAVILSLLIKHIIHHRGQMTVLMRQAGLKAPGVYGPAREEWAAIGMEAPPM